MIFIQLSDILPDLWKFYGDKNNENNFSTETRQNMKEIVSKRIVVYSKDIEQITGKKERAARKYLQTIKEKPGKDKGDLVSIDEFCEVTSFKLEIVVAYLVG